MHRSELAAALAARAGFSTLDRSFAPAMRGEQPPLGAAMPDHPSVRALLGALMAAGPQPAGWRRGDQHAHSLQRVGLEAVRVRLRAATSELAWQEVCAVSPLALDVLIVLLDGFSAGQGEVRLVRAGEIISAKGYRRWGAERQVVEAQIGRELRRLGRISVGDSLEPIFQVTPVGDGVTRFVLKLDPTLRDVLGAAPVRRLSRRILQFDHRLNRGADLLAKKLSLYFSLAGPADKPFARSVRGVLKAVGAAPDLTEGGARGGRLADRFEEALLRLHESGLFAVSYRGADSSLALEQRVKGWVKRWLEMELVIEPQSIGG